MFQRHGHSVRALSFLCISIRSNVQVHTALRCITYVLNDRAIKLPIVVLVNTAPHAKLLKIDQRAPAVFVVAFHWEYCAVRLSVELWWCWWNTIYWLQFSNSVTLHLCPYGWPGCRKRWHCRYNKLLSRKEWRIQSRLQRCGLWRLDSEEAIHCLVRIQYRENWNWTVQSLWRAEPCSFVANEIKRAPRRCPVILHTAYSGPTKTAANPRLNLQLLAYSLQLCWRT